MVLEATTNQTKQNHPIILSGIQLTQDDVQMLEKDPTVTTEDSPPAAVAAVSPESATQKQTKSNVAAISLEVALKHVETIDEKVQESESRKTSSSSPPHQESEEDELKPAATDGIDLTKVDEDEEEAEQHCDTEPRVVVAPSGRPSRRAKSAAASKIRKGKSESDDEEYINLVDDSDEDEDENEDEVEDEDENEDEDEVEDEESGSDQDNPKATQKQWVARCPRPSRRAKKAAVQKLAGCIEKDDDDDDEDDTNDEDDKKSSHDDERSVNNGSGEKGDCKDARDSGDSGNEAETASTVSEESRKRKTTSEDDPDSNTAKSKRHKKNCRVKPEEKESTEDSSFETAVVKTETSVKEEEEGPPKKKAKKSRVSEAVVRDAADKMLEVLIKNYKDEIKEVPLDILAASIVNKRGKPYTNYRSDAIQDGLKLLKAEQKAEKTRIINSKIGAARLMASEINKIPKEEISKDPTKVLEQREHQFLDRLANHKKGGTGKTVVNSAKAVFRKLKDGKAYSRKELVKVTSYKATNSSGFEGIMKVLYEMKLVEGKGKTTFTSKVFPHGRP